jgi:hypothetical protein
MLRKISLRQKKKLGDAYYAASEAAQRMKGTQKKEFLEQPKSDDYKLRPYAELIK